MTANQRVLKDKENSKTIKEQKIVKKYKIKFLHLEIIKFLTNEKVQTYQFLYGIHNPLRGYVPGTASPGLM